MQLCERMQALGDEGMSQLVNTVSLRIWVRTSSICIKRWCAGMRLWSSCHRKRQEDPSSYWPDALAESMHPRCPERSWSKESTCSVRIHTCDTKDHTHTPQIHGSYRQFCSHRARHRTFSLWLLTGVKVTYAKHQHTVGFFLILPLGCMLTLTDWDADLILIQGRCGEAVVEENGILSLVTSLVQVGAIFT